MPAWPALNSFFIALLFLLLCVCLAIFFIVHPWSALICFRFLATYEFSSPSGITWVDRGINKHKLTLVFIAKFIEMIIKMRCWCLKCICIHPLHGESARCCCCFFPFRHNIWPKIQHAPHLHTKIDRNNSEYATVQMAPRNPKWKHKQQKKERLPWFMAVNLNNVPHSNENFTAL